MSDYNATFECIDLMIDWADEYTDPNAIQFNTTDGDLTEANIFVNTGTGARHNSLGLLGTWMAGNKIADHMVLTQELFEPGSEGKFTILRISRPSRAGEGGFVAFEVVMNVTDSWSVDTNRGPLPVKRIALIMRLALTPMH